MIVFIVLTPIVQLCPSQPTFYCIIIIIFQLHSNALALVNPMAEVDLGGGGGGVSGPGNMALIPVQPGGGGAAVGAGGQLVAVPPGHVGPPNQ